MNIGLPKISIVPKSWRKSRSLLVNNRYVPMTGKRPYLLYQWPLDLPPYPENVVEFRKIDGEWVQTHPKESDLITENPTKI
jgi:hypothetical protein